MVVPPRQRCSSTRACLGNPPVPTPGLRGAPITSPTQIPVLHRVSVGRRARVACLAISSQGSGELADELARRADVGPVVAAAGPNISWLGFCVAARRNCIATGSREKAGAVALWNARSQAGPRGSLLSQRTGASFATTRCDADQPMPNISVTSVSRASTRRSLYTAWAPLSSVIRKRVPQTTASAPASRRAETSAARTRPLWLAWATRCQPVPGPYAARTYRSSPARTYRSSPARTTQIGTALRNVPSRRSGAISRSCAASIRLNSSLVQLVVSPV
jgi:hypothetical protein